ncbi:hypothetical protein [Mesorhizobium sp.]|uniref:hypothetical protein n=1 Tax=Mesorhizobium sp. TaxID=1871066 RepID=UPI001205AE9B|nr:hypothetical protein [Mesorhizobium sp.]TIL24864.1 MAG: hypothetical protein E5Y85_35345 [Mesorhizobium sp.]
MLRFVVLVLIATASSHSWGADLPQSVEPRRTVEGSTVPASLVCDDEQLAICLNGGDEEFDECEQKCKDDHPNGGGAYNDCRNDCRDTRDIVRQGCYSEHCTEDDQ